MFFGTKIPIQFEPIILILYFFTTSKTSTSKWRLPTSENPEAKKFEINEQRINIINNLLETLRNYWKEVKIKKFYVKK